MNKKDFPQGEPEMSESIRQNFLQKTCQYLFGKAPAALPQTSGKHLSLC